MKFLAPVTLILMLITTTASANRAKSLMEQIRCPTCTGQSIKESNTQAAKKLRTTINHYINQGYSNEEIVQQISKKYGDRVLLNPPIRKSTYLLWLSPILLILVFATFACHTLRKNKNKL